MYTTPKNPLAVGNWTADWQKCFFQWLQAQWDRLQPSKVPWECVCVFVAGGREVALSKGLDQIISSFNSYLEK